MAARTLMEGIERILAAHGPATVSEIKDGMEAAARRVRAILREESRFDTHGLRAEMWSAVEDGSARLRVFNMGVPSSTVVVVEYVRHPVKNLRHILRLWSRIFAVFGCAAAGAVVWFAHPLPRRIEPGEIPGPGAVNGGYCMRGRPDTIVIYRAEDATRVLIHELLHATWSDSSSAADIPRIEAETEAWAEILYAQLMEGREGVARQIEYAVKQNRSLRDHYGVDGPASYVWRYTLGREAVWRRLGFEVPSVPAQSPGPMSTCLTVAPLPKVM